MKYQTKELNVIAHPNNIVEIFPTKESGGTLTLEEVDNNLVVLEKVTRNNVIASLVHVSPKYVKKEVLKKYSSLDYNVIATALLVNSYGSK